MHVERSQERTHRGLRGFLRLTLDNCRGAYRSRARGRRRALGRCRTLDNGAARARAWRALTRICLTLAVIDDYRLGLGNAALQNILAQVRNRRALSLQHVI
jgi:hypothetical protein